MWNISEIEFHVLWEDMRKECVPEPFVFMASTKDPDIFAAQRAAARESLRNLGASFAAILDLIFEPDLYIVADGWGGKDSLSAAEQIRIRSSRKGSRGVVINQRPGDTFWRGGGYTVTECDALSLADTVSAGLPDVCRGGGEDIVLPSKSEHAPVEYGDRISPIRETFADSSAVKSEKFLNSSADTVGVIRIIQGSSIYGPRGVTKRELRWRDIEGDGRYVITDDNPPVATAVDGKRLTSLINVRVAAVVAAIKEERSAAPNFS